MVLRDLEQKDAPYMLEWMHDENVNGFLGKDFRHMTIQNCHDFIEHSKQDKSNRHYAIADDSDEYMGTISLKNIDVQNGCAEYAISCRTKAMGKGFARMATEKLFEIARDSLNLHLIYLNVYDYNVRAQKLYEKTGFERTKKPEFLPEEYDAGLLWYEKHLAE